MVLPAAALVGGLMGAVTGNVLAVVIKLVGKSYNLWSDFDTDIGSIKEDLRMILAKEEDRLSQEVDLSAVTVCNMEEMRDLAFEIEDFLDRILRHVVEKNSDPLYKTLGFASQIVLEDKVKKIKKRLEDAKQRQNDYKVNGCQLSDGSWTPPANTYKTRIKAPVGIDESKEEICEWVMKDVKVEPEQLRVISIVGFSGSGKSTLAKAVYDSLADKFHHRACVVASKHKGDTKMILMELLQKLVQGDEISDSDDVEQLRAKILEFLKKHGQGDKISDLGVEQLRAKVSEYLKNSDLGDEQLQAKISEYLKNKRYLIVIDDIKNETWWNGIKSAFPKKVTGRIIVTTTIQRVAKVCSHENVYVHNMEALNDKYSKELLQVVLEKPSSELERSSTSVRNICDGHPHALVTVANHLKGEDPITVSVCDELCNYLGSRMTTSDALKELQNVLMNSYRSLPKGFLNLKTCLLYICVFPNGCNIRRSRLIRRWSAEGFVQYDYPRTALDVAEENLKQLVDQSTIWPMDTSKNANVKTCRAHGIFHEFLLYMSTSAKFITSFDNEHRGDYRHLFIQSTSRGKSGDDEEKSRAHSLTICGSAGEAAGYFGKCQLLRVLDLEDCMDLKDEHLDGIHKMWYLKYLSVGNTITRLPKNIEKLYFLEILDMRKTKKEIILPVEVIKMPNLAHLLGRFKPDNKQSWEENKPEKSNLQTLVGFVSDNNPGFLEMLMYDMKQLKKVKIWAVWCNSTGEDPDLERAIQKFVRAEQDTGVARRSLSLDISNSYGNILRSLALGCLRSLKLHGQLKGLVYFAKFLYSLKELCLSSTNDLTENDLSDLREISDFGLEYLKLVGVNLGGFVIRYQDFREVRRLCLVQCPSLPTIEEGALPNLLSLRLLNQGLEGLSGIEIKQHKRLQEIALDSEVQEEPKADWEDAAKNHPKRPRVLYLKRVSPDDVTGSMVKYVATERAAPATVSSRERAISRVESNSVDGPSSSDSNHIDGEDGHSFNMPSPGSSRASTEFCSAMDNGVPSSPGVVSRS